MQEPSPKFCAFFLPRKGRSCRMAPVNGNIYCVNHLSSHGEISKGLPKRVLCPVDPTHYVLEAEIEAHVKKCPKHLAELKLKNKPCFHEDINAGSESDPELDVSLMKNALETNKRQKTGGLESNKATSRAAERAKLVKELGETKLMELIEKVDRIYKYLGLEPGGLNDLVLKYERPRDVVAALQQSDRQPFQIKHAKQHASFVGNMRRFGLLPGLSKAVDGNDINNEKDNDSPPRAVTLVEMGAGKAYLGYVVALHGGPKTASESSLDSKYDDVTVANTSIAGLIVSDWTASFKNKADRYLRHLPVFQRLALDLKDLDPRRISALAAPPVLMPKAGISHAHEPSSPSSSSALPSSSLPSPVLPDHKWEWVGIGKHLCGAATDYMLRACFLPPLSPSGPSNSPKSQSDPASFKGLCLSPCCHHRCSWRAYVGKKLMRSCGLDPFDFEIMTWMTGWALCRHGTCRKSKRQLGCQIQKGDKEGGRGTGGFDGADGDDGVRSDEEEEEEEEIGEDEEIGEEEEEKGEEESEIGETEKEEKEKDLKEKKREEHESKNVKEEDVRSKGWEPRISIPLTRRMEIGMKCKVILDLGRLKWIQSQSNVGESELIQYVTPKVSGENRLFLAKVL